MRALAYALVTGVTVSTVALLARGPASTEPGTPPTPLTDVRIGVFNATRDVTGMATSAGATIGKLGTQPQIGNWPDAPIATSRVLADAGHAAQGHRVADALGIRSVVIGPLPRTPDASIDALDVVAVLGSDLAPPRNRLLSTFAILREPAQNTWSVRSVDTPAGRARIRPSGTGLCLEVKDHAGWGGTCVDTPDAQAGKAVVSTRNAGDKLRSVVGLVPDGVASIELRTTSGRTQQLAVARNTWAATTADARQLSYRNAHGKLVTLAIP
jgi:hypothetical protein